MLNITISKEDQKMLKRAFDSENNKIINDFESKKNIQFKNGKYYCSKTNKPIHIIQE